MLSHTIPITYTFGLFDNTELNSVQHGSKHNSWRLFMFCEGRVTWWMMIRDVMKFEFDNIWTWNVFNRLEIWRMFQALCCLMWIRGNSLFCDWFHMHREPESVDKPVFFSNSTCHTNYSYWMCNIIFCSVMCSTVLILTLILLTLGNNILLQSFNWPKSYALRSDW